MQAWWRGATVFVVILAQAYLQSAFLGLDHHVSIPPRLEGAAWAIVPTAAPTLQLQPWHHCGGGGTFHWLWFRTSLAPFAGCGGGGTVQSATLRRVLRAAPPDGCSGMVEGCFVQCSSGMLCPAKKRYPVADADLEIQASGYPELQVPKCTIPVKSEKVGKEGGAGGGGAVCATWEGVGSDASQPGSPPERSSRATATIEREPKLTPANTHNMPWGTVADCLLPLSITSA